MINSKNILVTGATGFVGSHLCELLTEKGHKVTAFDRYNINNDYGWLNNSKYKSEIKFELGDIRDYDSVFESMKNKNVVFHLAALCGIPYSYTSPLAYINTNTIGTYNILHSAKNLNTEQIIITSTSETYGSAQYTPIDEMHPSVSQSPYAASKISADHLAISYFRSFDLPVKIARPFNVFGPRQSLRAVIPTIINQCINKQEEIYLGNITPIRDFTFVKDLCLAFMSIYQETSEYGDVINIGTGESINIMDLANKIINYTKSKAIIKTDEIRKRPENSEVNKLICDNRKILKKTKWKPQYNFDEGLKETITWFQNNTITNSSNKYHI
tara:strand:+ start:1362 stop:2345 length:984 start_codon:yes stop_codon:yes gene_type:complete